MNSSKRMTGACRLPGRGARAFGPVALALLCAAGCARDRGARWDGGTVDRDAEGYVDLECGGDPADDGVCVRGESDVYMFCAPEQEFFRVEREDCSAQRQVCVNHPPYQDCVELVPVAGAPVLGCALCEPCILGCLDGHVAQCSEDGSEWRIVEYCDTAAGEACESGQCVSGCEVAERLRSNVGCEYWAVDLDNAVDHGLSAASQQFAVVVSNPSSHNDAIVTVEACEEQPCSAEANLVIVEETIVNRNDLEVFELDAREVDGSPEGTFGTGPGTALGPRAYRVSSNWPIVAYQFNPLDNVPEVFSNDASLLLPTSALDTSYAILSWPQTIANAPHETFDSQQDFPAYLTVVGVEDDTTVTVTTTAPIVPSGEEPPVVPYTPVGGVLVTTIDRFDVLNLETGYYEGQHSFLSDFTGSRVESDRPVAVFAGVEATDVPIWGESSPRYAAADHLEQQQYPVRSLGYSFVVGHTPRRTQALAMSGATITPLATEPEWYRIMAVEDGTVVTTTIPGEEEIELDALEYVTLESDTHFIARSNLPIALGQFVGGQDTTGIYPTYPGGDPAFILVPPVEQWRTGYVFLTPDKYVFDFVVISVHKDYVSQVELDGETLSTREDCWRERADGLLPGDPTLPEYYVVTCALARPVWNPEAEEGLEMEPGEQLDGPHRIFVRAGSITRGIGIVVYGFDRYVSYGYAGGTDVQTIE
jgi:hypothetical protein